MDATELLYEAIELAKVVPSDRRATARWRVRRLSQKLEDLEAEMRETIGELETEADGPERRVA